MQRFEDALDRREPGAGRHHQQRPVVLVVQAEGAERQLDVEHVAWPQPCGQCAVGEAAAGNAPDVEVEAACRAAREAIEKLRCVPSSRWMLTCWPGQIRAGRPSGQFERQVRDVGAQAAGCRATTAPRAAPAAAHAGERRARR